MKIKIIFTLILGLLLSVGPLKPAFALEHDQKDGLFSIDIPEGWKWFETSQDIIITYPDGKTVAVYIQLAPGMKLSQSEIRKNMKESNEKIIKEGIVPHQGTLIDNKEITFDGVYATQLDFKTAPPNPVYVTYLSFFAKGYAFSIKYGSSEEKMRMVMEDVVSTFKFK